MAGSNSNGGAQHPSSGNENPPPTRTQLALQKVKRDEIEAKAVAWVEAKVAKIDNRFKTEETIIEAWEEEQKVKANIKLKTMERKLADKRATAFEKMQNENAEAHRKAESRRAVAKARRSAAKTRVTEAAEKIRSLGKLPRKFTAVKVADKIRSLGKLPKNFRVTEVAHKIRSLGKLRRKFLCV